MNLGNKPALRNIYYFQLRVTLKALLLYNSGAENQCVT